jgi:DGQHR domain-containing protein
MSSITMPEASAPRGLLTFKAIKQQDEDRIRYVGTIAAFDLIDKGFVEPVASVGLAPEVLEVAFKNGPIQRKTNPQHVQAIVDYIVQQAEAGKPFTFNSIVLYSTTLLEFEGTSYGFDMAGEARASEAMSVGEGLHRICAWGVATGLATIRGVKRPEMSDRARRRIEQASIPVIVIEEPDLGRQKTDFHTLNLQKPLSTTVLHLTDETVLSDITRRVISDVKLFQDRIDLNNASVGARSDKLIAFAQLRFIVASYLLGKKTRSKKQIEEDVESLAKTRDPRSELREVFTLIATNLGGLDRLHRNRVTSSGAFVRQLRAETLLSSSALWRALTVALHDAKEAGVDPKTAIERLKAAGVSWERTSKFFVGTLVDRDTAKLLSSRESIDAAADKLLSVMIEPTP